jgi:ferredoxin
MKNITIILPIHKLDEGYQEMLTNALKSIEDFYNDVKLKIVCPPSVKENLTDLSQKLEIEIITNNGNTDFCSQVNIGISSCDTEWFSIFEIDDEYKSVWLKSMNEYTKEYTDVDVFLPVVKDINDEGKFMTFINESVWAYGFTDKQGFLDNETLLEYQNYQTSGGLFRTQVIKDNGGLKENIKLTFSYELLLRLTHNGVKIMSVPKLGYEHMNLREDSLFWLYKNNEEQLLTEKEVKFWLETAKKEFFFKNKRDVNYTEA